MYDEYHIPIALSTPSGKPVSTLTLNTGVEKEFNVFGVPLVSFLDIATVIDSSRGFDMQFSQYDKDMEEQDMEDTVKDEELKAAEWEYFEDETGDSPYAEATATIDGKEVTVGYLWDEQDGGCYVRIDGADVEDRAICNHYCEVAQKAIGKELTGLSYELWESWVEYHGLHEGWEDMDEDERYKLYNKAIVQC